MTTTATSSSKKRPRPLSSLPPPPAIPCLSSPFPSPPSFRNTYLKPNRPCVLKQAGPSLLPKALALLGGQQGEAEGVVERLKAILGPELGRSTRVRPPSLPPSLPHSFFHPFHNPITGPLSLLTKPLSPSLPPSSSRHFLRSQRRGLLRCYPQGAKRPPLPALPPPLLPPRRQRQDKRRRGREGGRGGRRR